MGLGLNPGMLSDEGQVVLSVWWFLSFVVDSFWWALMWASREGNGTPLQYSCLETPMDRGAWWAAVHGVAEGWT